MMKMLIMYVWQSFLSQAVVVTVKGFPMSLESTVVQKQCRVCGGWDHRARVCPLLSSDDGGSSNMSFDADTFAKKDRRDALRAMKEMEAYEQRVIAKAKSAAAPSGSQPKAPAPRRGWSTPQEPEHYMIGEEDGITMEEFEMIQKHRAKKEATKAKTESKKALTGEEAPYPSLSNRWSPEVVLNVAGCVRSKMLTFQWKKMLWQLRVKEAVPAAVKGAKWQRNQRWLAKMFAKEVGFLYGHFGAVRKQLDNPRTWSLM